jgi:uncharacterized protein YPO0396
MGFLAEQATNSTFTIADLKEILGWVTAFVVAVLGAVLGPKLKSKWKEEAVKDAKVTIHPPVPTINVKEEVELVTKDELEEHLQRIEKNFEEIKETLKSERNVARQANGNLHARIDKATEQLAEVKGELTGIGKNLALLLELATKRGRSGS